MFYNLIFNKKRYQHYVYLLLISLFAFYINKFSGNNGIVPLDSFQHFDTSILILRDIYPIRDYWMTTGFFINFIQSVFFYVFGLNWQTYVLHASFFNIIISCSSYLFFNSLKIDLKYCFFYSICIATLFYPTSGTPLIYFHSSFFSIISMYLFIIAYLNKSSLSSFLIPFFMVMGFLCAQIPSAYINLLIILSFTIIFRKERKLSRYFILGSVVAFLFFTIFILITKIQFYDFYFQHILFSLNVGLSRLLSEGSSFSKFSDITFDRVFFDFKFIYIFLLPLMFVAIKKSLSNDKIEKHNNLVNYFFLISIILFIYYQLTTNNQLFIYFLIPIIAAFLQMNLIFFYEKKLIKLLFIIIISFITVKYGYRNIVEKRFNDFQWTDMSLHVQGDKINKNLSGLKWVTPKYWGLSPEVKNEVKIIKKVSNILTEDKRNKVLMTNYQLFLVTSKSHIYYTQPTFFLNSTQPDINNKYYKYYTEYYNIYYLCQVELNLKKK